MKNPEIKIYEKVLVPLSALGLFAISLGAFSKKSRRLINERDGGKSKWSGKGGNLEAAHVDHSRSNPKYNDPSNGRMLTPREHYQDHYNRHGRNGITKHQNKWSLSTIWGRLTKKDRIGLPEPSTIN